MNLEGLTYIVVGMGICVLMVSVGFMLGRQFTERRTFKDQMYVYAQQIKELPEEDKVKALNHFSSLLDEGYNLELIDDRDYKRLLRTVRGTMK